MGVSGLWDILRPAGTLRSLTHLAVVDGFESNRSSLRGLRIGIDASIWFFHAAYGREGENPELRTLFFRCARLMSMPFLPLFVFDGPKRPSVKRGKRISGNQHWLTGGMKEIIEAFGFEWRMAPGEAEAELAYLNDMGVIDAILSDDVDNFLFGAKMVVRNPSATLTGNRAHSQKNSDGREDGNHSIIYTSRALRTHPSIQLTRGGLILIGLLSGGDYHEAGVPRCGPSTAHGLAKCGFGDELLTATQTLPRAALADFLDCWRQEIRDELRTNARGHLGTKKNALAKSMPDDFPNIDILLSYTNPITSGTDAGAKRTHTPPKWDREPDLGKIAHLCEVHFEWGLKDIIIKRFRTVLWPSMVQRILRRATLETDARSTCVSLPSTPMKRKGNGHLDVIVTPSKMLARHFSSIQLQEDASSDTDQDDGDQLIVKIHSVRTHASTDGISEYRIEIAPAQLVRLSERGVQGVRKPVDTTYDVEPSDSDSDDGEVDKDGKKMKKAPPNPDSHLRMWMPASMVRIVRPDLVDEYEATVQKRQAKKSGKGKAASAKLGPRAGKKKVAVTRPEETDGETFDLNEGISSGSEDSLPLPPKATLKAPPKANASRKESGSVSYSRAASVPSRTAPSTTVPLFGLAPDDDDVHPPPSSQPSRPSVLAKLDNMPLPLASTPRRIPATPTKTTPLRPFPMAFEEEESSDDENDALPVFSILTASRHQPKSKTGQRRRRPVSPSHSDNQKFHDIITKSPRKSAAQTSPRKQSISPSKKPFDGQPRPPSPLKQSPSAVALSSRPVTSARLKPVKSADDSVIDISTDSEDDDTQELEFPLLLARARQAKASLPLKQPRRWASTSTAASANKDDDVIDLT